MKKLQLTIQLSVFTLLLLFSCSKKDSNSAPEEHVVYQTNFDDNDGEWYIGLTPSFTLSIQNGYYNFINKMNSGYSAITTNDKFVSSEKQRAIESKIGLKGNNLHTDYAGLVWDCAGEENEAAKVFYFANDGYFGIFGNKANGDYYEIQEAIFSQAVKKGADNILRIELKSETLRFFINGKEVYSMPAGDTVIDKAGFAINKNCTLRADYFKAITF